MKAILQYSASQGGPFTDYGVMRPRAGQLYTVSALGANTRAGDAIGAGFKVSCAARAITLASGFFDQDEWYFRVNYPTIPQTLDLGLRAYIFNFDGQHERNKIFNYTINLEFHIKNTDLPNYIIEMATLP